MLSLKLVRSLVLGDTINSSLLFNQTTYHDHNHNNHHDVDVDVDVAIDIDGHHTHANHQTTGRRRRSKAKVTFNNKKETTPLLVFLPTKEIVKDTYRLATIAREMGMDLNPNPSLSHIIFSWPSSNPSSSCPSLWSSSSSTWSLPSDAVPLPFPSLKSASITHLQCFVTLSKGLFKLVFYKSNNKTNIENKTSHWDCSSLSLFSRVTGDRIDSMESFSRVLAGMGWTLFKTKDNPSLVSAKFSSNSPIPTYLFRKVDSSRVRFVHSDNSNAASPSGEFRMRELRLPGLDFRNAPLRILQYILLMTDNVFYLA